MTKILNVAVLAAAAAAVIAASPASARTRHHEAQRVEAVQSSETLVGSTAAYSPNDPYVVTDGTHYLGRDPDLQIRSEILKDESAAAGTN